MSEKFKWRSRRIWGFFVRKAQSKDTSVGVIWLLTIALTPDGPTHAVQLVEELIKVRIPGRANHPCVCVGLCVCVHVRFYACNCLKFADES